MKNSVTLSIALFLAGFALSGLIHRRMADKVLDALTDELTEVNLLHKQAEDALNQLRCSIAAGMPPASLLDPDGFTTER